MKKKLTRVMCHWKYDDIDDYYETSCGKSHTFLESGVKENHYKYCPYCGKPIKVKITVEEE